MEQLNSEKFKFWPYFLFKIPCEEEPDEIEVRCAQK